MVIFRIKQFRKWRELIATLLLLVLPDRWWWMEGWWLITAVQLIWKFKFQLLEDPSKFVLTGDISNTEEQLDLWSRDADIILSHMCTRIIELPGFLCALSLTKLQFAETFHLYSSISRLPSLFMSVTSSTHLQRPLTRDCQPLFLVSHCLHFVVCCFVAVIVVRIDSQTKYVKKQFILGNV